MLEQAAAVVSVNQGDGSIIIHQGGVEMGQGLLTQVRQIASYVLNVPMDMIYVEAPRRTSLPNPTSTGASTGTPYNGEAVKRTCQESARAADGLRLRDAEGERRRWCTQPGHRFLELRRGGLGALR